MTENLPQAAARVVEAITMLDDERDMLRKRTDTQEVHIALLTRENDDLKQRLVITSAERDHYMKHSVELTARLNNIQIVINETIREARDATFRPSIVPLPTKQNIVSPEDQAKLETLIARLPGGNGEDK